MDVNLQDPFVNHVIYYRPVLNIQMVGSIYPLKRVILKMATIVMLVWVAAAMQLDLVIPLALRAISRAHPMVSFRIPMIVKNITCVTLWVQP